jgi:hypothetical protein
VEKIRIIESGRECSLTKNQGSFTAASQDIIALKVKKNKIRINKNNFVD